MLACGSSFAQVATTVETEDETENSKLSSSAYEAQEPDMHKVMLIPFEPKLYMSDIDRDIAREQGLSFSQIRSRMRYGLAASVLAEAGLSHSAVFMLSDDPEVTADLHYIYKSIGYRYEILETEEDKEKQVSGAKKLMDKVGGKFKKKEPEEEAGTKIKEGQVYSVPGKEERYMATKVINPNMFRYLSGKYGTGLYVFINQLNIEKSAGASWADLEAEDYKRVIKAHYTIVDWQGNELYGGAAKYYFSSRINDMNRIIKGMFRRVAQQITSHLPSPSITAAGGQNTVGGTSPAEGEKPKEQQKDLMEQY